MKISLKNVEEVIFLNKEIKDKLPEFKNYFYLWQLSKQQHFLKSVGTQAMIDLINNLNERHLNIIKEHYGVDVEFIKFKESEDRIEELKQNEAVKINVVGTASINNYGGSSTPQVQISDYTWEESKRDLFASF